MAKIESVIKAEIVRLAKREMRTAFLPMKREVRQMSTKLSGLSKAISSLNRLTKEVGLEEKAKPKLEATPEEVKTSRITPARIRSLRKKLGISLREMGLLTGVGLGAVLAWEKGKFAPRGDKKTALVALRKLGKRQVKELLQEKVASASPQPKRKAPPRAKKAGPRVAPKKPAVKQVRPGARKMRKAA